MVKTLKLLAVFTLLQISPIANAQKLAVSFTFGYDLWKNYAMLFGENPYQFLYAAPYQSNGESTYNQVRLAKIYGLSAALKPIPNRFGLNAEYYLKNFFRFNFTFNLGYESRNLDYSFQNILINLNDTENSIENLTYSTNNDPSLDDRITISSWFNYWSLSSDFFFKTKTKIKFFSTIAYEIYTPIVSRYNSRTKENKDQYSVSSNNDLYQEYLNTVTFQEQIFQEFKHTQLNHSVSLGLGICAGNFDIGYRQQFTFGLRDNPYYANITSGLLYFRYNLFNILLFR